MKNATHAEQTELHRQMKAGSQEAAGLLAESVLPAAKGFMAKMAPYMDIDDRHSAAGEAVAIWLKYWQPDKGRATTYLRRIASSTLARTLAKCGPVPHPYQPRAPLPTVENIQKLHVVDHRQPPLLEGVLQTENREIVHAAVATLPARLRTIIHYRFFANPPNTLHEVGLRLSVTKQRVSQLELIALKYLEEALEGVVT